MSIPDISVAEVLCRLPAAFVGSTVFGSLNFLDVVQFGSSCLSKRTHIMFSEALKWADPVDLSDLKVHIKFALRWVLNNFLKIGRITVEYDHDLALELLAPKIVLQNNVVRVVELAYQHSPSFLCSSTRSTNNWLSSSLLCARINTLTLEVCCEKIPKEFGAMHDLTSLRYSQLCGVSLPTLASILMNNQGITNLHLQLKQPTLTSDLCTALVSRLPTLTILHLAVPNMSQYIITLVGTHCRALTRLTLQEQFSFSGWRTVERNVSAVADGCPELVYLSLQCVVPTECSLESVVRSCRRLRCIKAPDTVLTESFYRTVAEGEPHLRDLYVAWDETAEATARSLYACNTFFEYLHSFCVTVKSDIVGDLQTLALALSLMTNLECLHFMDSSLYVPVVVLQSVADNCVLLKELYLECFVELAACEVVHKIIRNCKHLEVLHLDEGAAPCDETLSLLGRYCHKLHTLVMKREMITDQDVIALAKGCPKMRHLHLWACTCLTDASLHALQQHCPELHSLYVSKCTKLTPKGVTQLVRGCRKLRELHVSHKVMTEEDALEIRKITRGLHIRLLPVHLI